MVIYTDGACSGNPGPGGWAAALRDGNKKDTISGGAKQTTNNRMGLTTAMEALKKLKRPCKVTLYTDSTYVKNGIESWIHNWKKNGWKTAAKKPVLNAELWRELEEVAAKHEVQWKWVKGHAGDEMNELVDSLAVAELEKYK